MVKIIIWDFMRTLYDPDHRKMMPFAKKAVKSAEIKGYTNILGSKNTKDKVGLDTVEILKASGMDKMFASILINDQKDEGIFQKIVDDYKPILSQSYVVSDRAATDIWLGKKFGLRTIWYRNGKFKDELAEEGYEPEVTVVSLKAVAEII